MAPAGAKRRMKAGPMIARWVTALVGGYAATASIATLAARLLPLPRVEATAWAMIWSFLVFAGLILWSFHEPRLGRVAAIVWGIAAIGGGTAWLLGMRP